MISKLKYIASVLVILLVPALSYASDDTKSAEGKCFLWEVHSRTATIFLMGSFHMFKSDMYPLDDCINDAFHKADTLVVEVNMMTVDQNKVEKLFKEQGIYQGDVTLEQRLSKETLDKLKNYLGRNGVDIKQVNKMKPWFLGMTIAVQEMIKLGYDPNLGVDMYFLENADDMNIVGLETIEEQLDILAGDSEEVQDLALRMALEDIPDLESLMNSMVDAWSKGDAETLDKIMREPEDRYPLLEQQIKRTIDDRNVMMAKRIAGFLKTDKTYFMVVGGGHIGGKKGILSLLKDRGYSIQQIPKAVDSMKKRQNAGLFKPVEVIALSR